MRRILKWKQECYRKFAIADIPTSDITSSSLDESFMEKAIKAVEDNIEIHNSLWKSSAASSA